VIVRSLPPLAFLICSSFSFPSCLLLVRCRWTKRLGGVLQIGLIFSAVFWIHVAVFFRLGHCCDYLVFNLFADIFRVCWKLIKGGEDNSSLNWCFWKNTEMFLRLGEVWILLLSGFWIRFCVWGKLLPQCVSFATYLWLGCAGLL
jgi:hypothetical protein